MIKLSDGKICRIAQERLRGTDTDEIALIQRIYSRPHEALETPIQTFHRKLPPKEELTETSGPLVK